MGYATSETPGPRWFAARSFVLEPIKSLLSSIKNPPSPSIHALIHLQKIRLDLARGIVLMAGRVPVSGNIYELLHLAAKAHEKSNPSMAERLTALAAPGFKVSYGGTGQYSVPNYDLVRGNERERATGDLGPLFHAAFAERIEHGKALKEIAVESLCEIYLSESAYDHNYYSHWEAKKPCDILETCIAYGVFPDEQAALSACDGDLDNLRSLEVVKALGERLNREYWAEIHEEQWYAFNELDAMFHGCSD